MVGRQIRSSSNSRCRTTGEYRRVLITFCLTVVLSGCGYSFVTAKGRLSDGGSRLCIAMSTSMSEEAQVVPLLTGALRARARKVGLSCPAKGKNKTIPLLLSSVRSIEAFPRGVTVYAGRYRTREQEIVLKVRFTLKEDAQDDHTWTLQERVSYLSAPDIRGTEANRQMALRTAIDSLSRKAMDSLIRGF